MEDEENDESIKMEYKHFVTINLGNECSTFGYFWIKECITSPDVHLYIGKPGKETCMHFVYNPVDKLAFKTNIGRFCKTHNKSPLRAGTIYLMMFCGMYLITKKYPDCKLIIWKDDILVDLKINNKIYPVNCSNLDTIMRGYPKLEEFISRNSIVSRNYNNKIYDLHNIKSNPDDSTNYNELLSELSDSFSSFDGNSITLNSSVPRNNIINCEKLSFKNFYKAFYKIHNLFTKEELCNLKSIYDNTDSLTTFFKLSEEYLQKHNKSKWIFIPLKEILNVYCYFNFNNEEWIVDIHVAINYIKHKHNAIFSTFVKKENHQTSKSMLKKVIIPRTSLDDSFYKIDDILYNLDLYKRNSKWCLLDFRK